MKTKRILSIALTLVMLLGMLPGMNLTAYAANNLTIYIMDELENMDDNEWGYQLYDGDVSIAEGTYVQINMGTWHTGVMNIYMNGEVVYTKPSGSLYKDDVYHFTAGPNCKILGGYQNMFDWDGNPNVYITQDASVAVTGVTLNPNTAQTIDVGGSVAFTATVEPAGASDKTVKWSVGGTNADAVKLYSDSACTTEVGADATDKLTVYAKGESAGSATVTATSNADSTKSASCDVTVNAGNTTISYASLKNTTTEITFDGKSWYLIDYDDSTVTLLSKECVGASKYNESGSYVEYNNDPAPTIKNAVDNYYEDSISTGAKAAVSGRGMFLLTTAQANAIGNADVLKCSQASGADYNYWWLSSRAEYAQSAVVCVEGVSGEVYGDGANVKLMLGVRPALKLDLSKVTFDSTSKTFSLKSYGGNPYASLVNQTTDVTFDGKTWYIIEDNSTAADAGTVTLLAKECVGASEFGNISTYSGSTVETFVNNWYTNNNNISADAKTAVSDNEMFLLTTAQATAITNEDVRKCTNASNGGWWLCSRGYDFLHAAFVDGEYGGVIDTGSSVENTLGVRPALELDLSKVTFDSATNTFAILPYPLWVGGVQVTSANKDDVLGDTDEGATVVFTPAVDDNTTTTDVDESRPATLTLNSAIINGGNNDSEYAAIYAKGLDLTINVTGDSTVTGPETNDLGDSKGIYIDDGCLTITGSGILTTKGGESATYSSYGIDVDRAVTINGSLKASGGETQGAMSCGIYAGVGITVGSSGTLAASGGTGEAGSYGIWSNVTVYGSLTATGDLQAIIGTVKNSVAGTGWTDKEGTTGKASIAVSEAGQELNTYKKVQFPAYTVTYKVVNGTWSDDSTTDKTEGVPAGSKPSSVPTGMKASEGYTGGAWDTNPADLTITEAKTFTYTFTAKSDQTAPTGLTATKASSSTATDGKISGVTSAMEYQADGASTWTAVGENKTEITGLTSGTYKVRYAGTADKNASPEITIVVGVKVAPTVTAPTAKTLTYNGQPQALITAGTAEGGTMQYALGNATKATEPYTTSIPTKTEAGTYYVWYKVVGDTNHNDTTSSKVEVNIKQADVKVTAPTAINSTYNGKEQALVNAGVTEDGKVFYRLGTDGTWTNTVPTAKNVGEYEVYYYVDGDDNHSDSGSAEEPLGSVKVTIAKKTDQSKPEGLEIENVSAENATDGSITGVTDNMEYSTDDGKTWNAVPANADKIEGLAVGEVLVRYAGSDDKNASAEVTLTIGVASKTEGVVEFKPEEGGTTVAEKAITGVDNESTKASVEDFAETQQEEGKDVKVALEITPQKEENVNKESVEETNKVVEEVFVGIDREKVVTEYLAIDVAKYVDNGKETENISDTKTPLEIALRLDGKKTNPIVVRTHDGKAKAFGKLKARPAKKDYKDAMFYIDVENAILYIYSQYFSDFAIVYANEVTYNVGFVSGTSENLSPLVVAEGGKVTLPTGLKNEGYAFDGWYKDEAYTTAWKENDTVNEDITLYAKWNKSVTGVSVATPEERFTKAGETSDIKVTVTPEDAANTRVTYKSSDTKVATVDANGKITAVANGTATITITTEDGAKTATVKVTVAIPDVKQQGTTEQSKTTEQPVQQPTKEEKAVISMNAGLKVSQTGSKINIKWGKVKEADGYDVYVAYCGKKFGKAVKTINKNSTTSITVKKINSKKINFKKNFKVYVAAYKMVDGKKEVLAKSIMGHVVGCKNTKYSNAKKITIAKSNYSISVGKTAKIKAKTVLVQKGKKQLTDAHAKEFRYASSNKNIATVDQNGKIKGVAKGICTIYVYARNGYAKTVKITVK